MSDQAQPPLIVFEVDLNEVRPVTWRVEAHDRAGAIEKAKDGQGLDVSGVDYVYGEIVDVRYAEESAGPGGGTGTGPAQPTGRADG